MAREVRTKRVSPVELVQCSLDAIERTDEQINAWCEVVAGPALERARVLESEALKGEFRGPLHGVPIGVKDLFLTAGVPTRKGSILSSSYVPQETSPAVARMLEAGAIMIGKNTTAETGWKAASTSPLTGVTRNPWDPKLTTGGSSSGSAAAVAAGTVPISLGSDGGGSLRIPASFCGVFSLKPTLGRVPTFPLSASEQLSHAGVLTQTVQDSALSLDVLQGVHAMDPNSLPREQRSYLDGLTDPPPRLRVAMLPTLFNHPVSAEVARIIGSGFDRIGGLSQVEVCTLDPGWKDPIDIFDRLWVARVASRIHDNAVDLQKVDPGLARMIGLAQGLSLQGHLQALQQRATFSRQVSEAFETVDLIITPTVPIEPFAAECDGPSDMDSSTPVPWARWTPFTYPFNLTGHPAASVPCGWTSQGLPVGMQVIGGRFAEAMILQFCAALEAEFRWQERRPPVFAAH